MNAFGPFRREVTVDFKKFEHQPLFLVSGPTGAGKTTIFDALAYALYGEASGNQRLTKEFRSQFAEPEDISFVELHFEHYGKEYVIRREPWQKRLGSQGRMIEANAKVELHTPKGSYSKINQVNNFIQDLINLDYQQFQQIVLLPQGQFRKLLDSSSSEKEDIFRDIFNTYHFQKLQDKIRQKVKKLQSDHAQSEEQRERVWDKLILQNTEQAQSFKDAGDHSGILSLLKEEYEVDCTAHEAAEVNESKWQEALQNWQRKVEVLGEWQSLSEKYHRLIEGKIENDGRKEALKFTQEAEKINALNKAFQDKSMELVEESKKAEQYRKNENELSEAYKKQTEQFEPLEKKYFSLDDKRRTVEKTKEILGKFEQKKQWEEQVKELEAELAKLETADLKREQTFIELKEEKSKQKELIQNLEKQTILAEDIANQLEIKRKEQENRQNQQARLVDYQKEVHHFIVLQEAYQVIEAQYSLDKLQVDEAERLYRHNIAGLIAQDLIEKKPCPVCGSLDHPQPAKMHAEVITREELDTLKENLQEVNGKVQVALDRIENSHRLLDNFFKETQVEQVHLVNQKVDLLEEIEKEQEELEKLKVKHSTIKEELAQEKVLRVKLSEVEEDWYTLKEVAAQEKTLLKEYTKQLENLNKKLEVLMEELVDSDYENSQERLKNLQTEIQETTREYNQTQKDLTELSGQLEGAKAALQTQKQHVERLTLQKNKQAEAYQKELAQSSLGENFAEFLLEEERVKSYQREIEEYEQELYHVKNRRKELLEQFTILKDNPDMEVWQAQIEQAEIHLKSAKEQVQEYVQRLTINRENIEHLEEILNATKHLQSEFAIYSDLDTFANGSTITQNVSFERYVLGIYLDEVLAAANTRFKSLTYGRYILKRAQESRNLQGKRGLEINVLDEYTGRHRSVASLSGGESFKASLSLALGMSDVIQSQQGGISVDTLFIDEGFGTLDAESLDTAVETLLELNTHGRMIGIISHVEELKTRIPAQIEVLKTQSGSDILIKK